LSKIVRPSAAISRSTTIRLIPNTTKSDDRAKCGSEQGIRIESQGVLKDRPSGEQVGILVIFSSHWALFWSKMESPRRGFETDYAFEKADSPGPAFI